MTDAVEIPLWGWIGFGVLIVVLLGIDHFVHRGQRGASRKVALVWSVIWIGAGLGFNLVVWGFLGTDAASEYLAVYLIEKALSTDNMFIFLIVFTSLHIPKDQQHSVLFWGIAGAVGFRALLIFLGATALERWEWVTYIFGVVILYAAYRALRQRPGQEKESAVVKSLSRRLPVTQTIQGGKFVAREKGGFAATPLLLALVAIEITDLMMAIDSVAVAFSMTRNPFVIYTSNIFAILGLRAVYLLLAHTIGELSYLHYGLAVVLAFAGFKLLADPIVHIPPLFSVAFTVLVIGISVWTSLNTKSPARAQA
jgi:tellurite resistance protein TerC